MARFAITFLALYAFIFAAATWSLLRSFPAQDSETLPPEEIKFRDQIGVIFDLVILPAKGLGKASVFVGSAIWALPLACAATSLMKKNTNNGAEPAATDNAV